MAANSVEGEIKTFLDKLDIPHHPLAIKIGKGELSEKQVKGWAKQWYHGFLKDADRWLAQAFVNCPVPGMRRAIIENAAEEAWGYQQRVEAGAEVVVGVNRFVEEAPPPGFALHRHAERFEAEQAAALTALRETRDSARVRRALDDLRAAAAEGTNLMPVLVETVKTYATIGEICGVLREEFGEYRAPQVY